MEDFTISLATSAQVSDLPGNPAEIQVLERLRFALD
jgi:hypothetical protein